MRRKGGADRSTPLPLSRSLSLSLTHTHTPNSRRQWQWVSRPRGEPEAIWDAKPNSSQQLIKLVEALHALHFSKYPQIAVTFWLCKYQPAFWLGLYSHIYISSFFFCVKFQIFYSFVQSSNCGLIFSRESSS